MKKTSLISLLANFWEHISIKRRFQLIGIVFLIILVSLVEIISIGAVLPFLAALTSPEKIEEIQLLQPVLSEFNFSNTSELRLFITIFFTSVVIFSGIVRLILIWTQTRFGYAVGADISISCYRKILYLPYLTLISKNSSEFITGIINKTGMVVTQVVLPILLIISTSIILIAIFTALLFVDSFVALVAGFGFLITYCLVILTTKNRLIKHGTKISLKYNLLIQSLQEGLGGIRDVIIDGNQETYCKIFKEVDLPLRKAEAGITIIGQTPRFIVEALGISILSIIAYYLSIRPDGISSAIPTLGVFALAAQRLLPILQQIYQSWTSILGCSGVLEDILFYLNHKLPKHSNSTHIKPIKFNNTIEIKNLCFSYSSKNHKIIEDFSCKINKGEKIGLIGETGSGKSTLIDLIMGLLIPKSGKILIDNKQITKKNYRSWQLNIAHVPQNIFLSDTSIRENIAFGVPKEKINDELIYKCTKIAQINDTIESWHDKYNTLVGERGVRLSGGQKQRIGIARALYKNSNVIIFDEATSALDEHTESKVMDSIFDLDPNITLIFISHRLSTLKHCSQIIELKDGKVFRRGSFNEIIDNKK